MDNADWRPKAATMPFGEHIGKKLVDLPDDYLRWLVEEANIHSSILKSKIDREWERRRREQTQRALADPSGTGGVGADRTPDQLKVVDPTATTWEHRYGKRTSRD